MTDRHLVHLWRQMKIHRILTQVCLHQIGCLCYCCYAKTSSSAVQKRHSKVYGNLIAPPSIQYLLGKNNFILSEAYSGRGLWWLSPSWTSEIYCFQVEAPTGPQPPHPGKTKNVPPPRDKFRNAPLHLATANF